MTELARAVHTALNATAAPRRAAAADLPPLAPQESCALPSPIAGETRLTGLVEVLRRRRSSYSFDAQLGLEELASLLRLGIGTAPRAGGLSSLVPYVVTRGLDGLPSGVHRADLRLPVPNLAAVRRGDATAYVAGALDQPQFAGLVPLWLALVADLEAARGRYPGRHYRTLHVDAGAALQNVLLVATSLGLSVCPVMGYDDWSWQQLLGLEEGCFVTVLVAIGGRPR